MTTHLVTVSHTKNRWCITVGHELFNLLPGRRVFGLSADREGNTTLRLSPASSESRKLSIFSLSGRPDNILSGGSYEICCVESGVSRSARVRAEHFGRTLLEATIEEATGTLVIPITGVDLAPYTPRIARGKRISRVNRSPKSPIAITPVEGPPLPPLLTMATAPMSEVQLVRTLNSRIRDSRDLSLRIGPDGELQLLRLEVVS